MQRLFLFLALLLAVSPHSVHAQNDGQLLITSPEENQVLQGAVTVSGTVTTLGFSSYELAFAYQGDATQTWFTISSSEQPVYQGELGIWDTSTLTDGDYALRLRVFLLDGSTQETSVSGLRVRNYTSVPTNTPEPTPTSVSPLVVAPTAQLIVPEVATVTPSLPTPTPFPPNPVGLTVPAISGALGRGALLVLLLFLGFGLILRLRRD